MFRITSFYLFLCINSRLTSRVLHIDDIHKPLIFSTSTYIQHSKTSPSPLAKSSKIISHQLLPFRLNMFLLSLPATSNARTAINTAGFSVKVIKILHRNLCGPRNCSAILVTLLLIALHSFIEYLSRSYGINYKI